VLQDGENAIKEKRHTGAPDSDKAQGLLDFCNFLLCLDCNRLTC